MGLALLMPSGENRKLKYAQRTTAKPGGDENEDCELVCI